MKNRYVQNSHGQQVDINTVDCAMHFICSHKFNTNSVEHSSGMNSILFRA